MWTWTHQGEFKKGRLSPLPTLPLHRWSSACERALAWRRRTLGFRYFVLLYPPSVPSSAITARVACAPRLLPLLVDRYITMGGFEFVEDIPLMPPTGKLTQDLPIFFKDTAAQARYLQAQATWAEEDFRELLQSVAAKVNNATNMTSLKDVPGWEGYVQSHFVVFSACFSTHFAWNLKETGCGFSDFATIPQVDKNFWLQPSGYPQGRENQFGSSERANLRLPKNLREWRVFAGRATSWAPILPIQGQGELQGPILWACCFEHMFFSQSWKRCRMEVLYFYDERDGEVWSGWFIGDELAGLQYTCVRPGPADLPDEKGWVDRLGGKDPFTLKFELLGGATSLVEAELPQDAPRCLAGIDWVGWKWWNPGEHCWNRKNQQNG